jgi:hypothetical protein
VHVAFAIKPLPNPVSDKSNLTLPVTISLDVVDSSDDEDSTSMLFVLVSVKSVVEVISIVELPAYFFANSG